MLVQLLKYIFFVILLLFISYPIIADEKFLSLKKNKVNVRYGPGFDYPVKFVYVKKKFTY